MPTDELGGGMGDDIGAKVHGAAQVGRGKGVVHHQRHPGFPGHGGHGFEVEDVVERVADGFGVDGLGVSGQRPAKVVRVVGVHEHNIDAEFPEGYVKLGVGATVQGGGRDQFIPLFHQGQQRHHLRRHARAHGQRRASVFQRRHAFFEHGGGRVHHARIDVAEGLQVKQAGGMIGVIEHVGRGLVDGHRPGTGHRIGYLPGVQAQRLNTEFFVRHGLI